MNLWTNHCCQDVINAEVLDDNDSVIHWIGKTIKTVWELEKIHKQHDADRNRVWTCGHCELVVKQWNHTKALSLHWWAKNSALQENVT